MHRAKRFLIILIKPSHYDDDGYVIQWVGSPIPSNSLASVYNLIDDGRRREALGDDVEIDIDVIDETNTVIRFNKLIRRLKRRTAPWSALSAYRRTNSPARSTSVESSSTPVFRRMAEAYTSFDAGRGSPFQCSFCTIIKGTQVAPSHA
jgi:hypothetical protein